MLRSRTRTQGMMVQMAGGDDGGCVDYQGVHFHHRRRNVTQRGSSNSLTHHERDGTEKWTRITHCCWFFRVSVIRVAMYDVVWLIERVDAMTTAGVNEREIASCLWRPGVQWPLNTICDVCV